MPAVLVAVLGFVVSGLVWRVLASIGFSLVTASFIHYVINDYIMRFVSTLNSALSQDIVNLLGIAGVDSCLSIFCGALTFVATYKSLKLMFVRGGNS